MYDEKGRAEKERGVERGWETETEGGRLREREMGREGEESLKFGVSV